MLGFFTRLWLRYKALSHITLQQNGSRFIFAGSVNIRCKPGARIIVNKGIVRIGYHLPGQKPQASYVGSEINLEEGATLQFDDDVCIAPGTTILIGKSAKAVFAGKNFVSYNFKLVCSNDFYLGRFSSISWNVTLIDDDQHHFRRPDGKFIRKISRPLVIGDNVGIQMHATVPHGIRIGNCSVISAGTIVRQDIPEYTTVFQDTKLKVKHGFSCGPIPEDR